MRGSKAQQHKSKQKGSNKKSSHLLKDRLVVIHVVNPDDNLRGGRQGLGSA